MGMKAKATALRQGLVRCYHCGHLITLQTANHLHHCPVCRGGLYPRLPHSLQHTLAYLICAYALYIPANMLDIMIVTKMGGTEHHTILSGILSLIQDGMIQIALLVLVASILVPLLKLLGITLLLLKVHYRWRKNTMLWMQMYRLIIFVGRWSMLDIFMISLLVGVVDLGGVSDVAAGSGAIAFGAVVVLTMFAAKSFDPRLIWDSAE